MKRPSKSTIVSLAVAVPLAVTAGYLYPSASDAMTLGASAASVAHDLNCTGYKQEASHNSLYTHHDAGTCTLKSGVKVRVVTFDHGTDSKSFDQTIRFVGLFSKQNGAFASDAGWNVTSATSSLAVAQAVVNRLGGAVHALPTSKATTTTPTTKATPTATKTPTK